MNGPMKVETTLPLQKEARILQFTKDESLVRLQAFNSMEFTPYCSQLSFTIDKQNAYLTELLAWLH